MNIGLLDVVSKRNETRNEHTVKLLFAVLFVCLFFQAEHHITVHFKNDIHVTISDWPHKS